MRAGDYVNVRGRKAQWFEKEKGAPDRFPDYQALIVEMHEERSLFYCNIMKSDGSLWNQYEKNIIGYAA